MVEKEYTDLVLPKDCNQLFRNGKLNRIPENKSRDVCQGFENAEESDLVDNFDLETADTSQVKDMSRIFYRAKSFNQDISEWDTSNVTDMRNMFWEAKSFNQDISEWDTSNVTDMRIMFGNAESFDQDISSWDVSSVTDINGMFMNTQSFDQDISGWNWDLNLINKAFPNDKFRELCDQMSYGAFEDRELHKLSEEKIRILVEHNIIGEETALSNVI